MHPMNPNREVVENIGISLNAIKTLRSSVGHVFGSLTEATEESKETKFLLDLQELLNTVNTNLK